MRWFASLVVLCLLAGTTGNVRPRVLTCEKRETGDLRMTSADGALPLVTARRAAAPAPDQRFIAFAIVSAAPSFVAPPRALVEDALFPSAQLAPTPGRATSARGPPDGFSVENSIRS